MIFNCVRRDVGSCSIVFSENCTRGGRSKKSGEITIEPITSITAIAIAAGSGIEMRIDNMSTLRLES